MAKKPKAPKKCPKCGKAEANCICKSMNMGKAKGKGGY